MNEAQYLESCRLQTLLRNLQHDQQLSQKQRKIANECFKELCNHPFFPSVDPSVVQEMISKVFANA